MFRSNVQPCLLKSNWFVITELYVMHGVCDALSLIEMVKYAATDVTSHLIDIFYIVVFIECFKNADFVLNTNL